MKYTGESVKQEGKLGNGDKKQAEKKDGFNEPIEKRYRTYGRSGIFRRC